MIPAEIRRLYQRMRLRLERLQHPQALEITEMRYWRERLNRNGFYHQQAENICQIACNHMNLRPAHVRNRGNLLNYLPPFLNRNRRRLEDPRTHLLLEFCEWSVRFSNANRNEEFYNEILQRRFLLNNLERLDLLEAPFPFAALSLELDDAMHRARLYQLEDFARERVSHFRENLQSLFLNVTQWLYVSFSNEQVAGVPERYALHDGADPAFVRFKETSIGVLLSNFLDYPLFKEEFHFNREITLDVLRDANRPFSIDDNARGMAFLPNEIQTENLRALAEDSPLFRDGANRNSLFQCLGLLTLLAEMNCVNHQLEKLAQAGNYFIGHGALTQHVEYLFFYQGKLLRQLREHIESLSAVRNDRFNEAIRINARGRWLQNGVHINNLEARIFEKFDTLERPANNIFGNPNAAPDGVINNALVIVRNVLRLRRANFNFPQELRVLLGELFMRLPLENNIVRGLLRYMGTNLLPNQNLEHPPGGNQGFFDRGGPRDPGQGGNANLTFRR